MLPSGNMCQSLLGYAAGTQCACVSVTGVLCWSGTVMATPTDAITASSATGRPPCCCHCWRSIDWWRLRPCCCCNPAAPVRCQL
jgi:hypothetical protein